MPKNAKRARAGNARTKSKGVARTAHDLRPNQSKKIKGGSDPTSVRLPSPKRYDNPMPQKV